MGRRRGPGSKGRDAPFHDYYVWQGEKPESAEELVCPGEEKSNWAWDDEAQHWYFHRFYAEQPDLNTASPAVRDEIAKIGGFWLALGVVGYRIDAVPFLLEEVSGPEGEHKDPHSLLRELSGFLTRRRGDALLLGEVNLPYDKAVELFGDAGDELNMMFNFPLNQAMYGTRRRPPVPPPPRRRVGERGRTTPRPTFPAELDGTPDPPAQGMPGTGLGTLSVLHAEGPVLAHRCDWDGNSVVAVHNLSGNRHACHCRWTAPACRTCWATKTTTRRRH